MLRQRGPAAASFFACLLLTGCAVPPSSFSPADARAHLDALAGSIGSRPIGSQRNIDARTYLIDRLSAYGFTVEVQETETSREDLGIRAHVANIVATRAGEEPDAIALVAHYDSVADGPGAADDAFGTAVVLEAARALTLDGHRYTLVVLLTDGEEAGLLGAASAAANGTFDSRTCVRQRRSHRVRWPAPPLRDRPWKQVACRRVDTQPGAARCVLRARDLPTSSA